MTSTAVPRPTLLSVTDLSVSLTGPHGRVSIVDSLSLDIGVGEVLGIAGESGSGKSITALSLMGLLPDGAVSTGSVRLDGRELLGRSQKDWRSIRGAEIGMIFQDPMTSLHPMLTVGRQITEHAIDHGVITKREAESYAHEMLRKVRIPDPESAASAYPGQFSGGMRQRVAIAAALACKPRLLIADEPTTALDVTVQAGVLHLLRDLCREIGMSVLLITHDLGVMSAVADRLAVFYAGRVVECGQTATVLREPRHPYTRGLLDALPGRGTEDHRFCAIPGAPPAPGTRPPGCVFEPRCPNAVADCTRSIPPLSSVARDHVSACFVDPFAASSGEDLVAETT